MRRVRLDDLLVDAPVEEAGNIAESMPGDRTMSLMLRNKPQKFAPSEIGDRPIGHVHLLQGQAQIGANVLFVAS